ncbi:hypothetical protein PF005_g7666 [Phytophthora fragariae]|uniref:Uncharacterized protein n=1 Tax=Phytophthora fragariae TaxID=53985 RepID=A0A6A3SR15_9STRA|nr:hypothetical protein PF003_g36007 [Phytophthora fragariae]KAE8942326.1 hypothetical protein PF009_g7928 [Phytophthora fragariae]KAE9015693.1 hypothetical protein PF011_g7511 [Phytophthora fragariae]KAE9121255.1 hypothetical protein PF007_g7886 [Phytophthora fragariae]KAE9123463.1 hypothetical protein PF010_g6402 [Phytophthora fragariae]
MAALRLLVRQRHAERKVLIDSHTPWLWDGEEFLRSANNSTPGYDLYSPSRLGNVVYHNYAKKPASFWASPMDPEEKELGIEENVLKPLHIAELHTVSVFMSY